MTDQDKSFSPPIPETQQDCLLEVMRRTMAGLEYALLNPEHTSEVLADLHDSLVRAYVEDDGGRAMLMALYSDATLANAKFPMGRELTYLASPYSARGVNGNRIEKERFEQASVVAAELFRRGTHVFAPIPHTHPIKDIGGHFPGSFEFWASFDTRMLAMCDTLTVCMLPGWKESVGVTAEVELAKKFRKPIRCLDAEPILLAWKKRRPTIENPWPCTFPSDGV